MSDEKVLTKEIAEQFLEDEDSSVTAAPSLPEHPWDLNWHRLDLSEFSQIEDDAAKSLSEFNGTDEIDLRGLTSLTDAAAESLGKCKVRLRLDGLTSLSDAAAESLSTHEGELYLDGLSELSDAAAESLIKHEEQIAIQGVKWLSNAAKATFQECNASRSRQDLDSHYIDLEAVLPEFDSMADVREYFADVELGDE